MSEYLTNYHTHTTYCDGNSTPREICEEAVSLGMKELGFSGHSYTSIDESYCMSIQGTKQYYEEINALKVEYDGRLGVLCGLERDYFADPDSYDWDLVIGSCHYVKKGDEYFPVDESPEILMDACDRLYGGDIYSLIRDYYSEEGNVYAKTGCQIVGHFDLITKFNEGGALFDEQDIQYIDSWMGALDRILSDNRDIIFEINTGAMSRGYRKEPYPSSAILEELGRRDAKVILSSDSHEKKTLLYGFDDAERIALDAGVELLNRINF